MSRPRVLIAEDDWLVAQAVVRAVGEAGFAVAAVAADGQEAVELGERLRPDLVLMDLEMPRLRGEAAAVRLAARCAIPVIALSAHRPRDMEGFVGHLDKPPSVAELRALVERVLANR